jgi:cellobiose dehydrogenase (acceptor)
MTPIPRGTYVNDTAFSYTFLCSNCIGEDALVLSNETSLGWAFSDKAVTMPASASSALTYHTAGLGTFSVNIADAKSKQYGSWAKLAISGSTGTSTIYNPTGNAAEPVTGGDATSGAAPKKNVTATTSNSTYDYIVCGAGPSGIIVAQRLSESGKSVLLVEGGGPSFASTGNNDTLSWNSTMTMYDVPALGYYLGKVGEPSYCTDTASIAGCLLGGGTAVNAMMFVKPSARDFDDKWPSGWRWKDVSESAGRLYERNRKYAFPSLGQWLIFALYSRPKLWFHRRSSLQQRGIWSTFPIPWKPRLGRNGYDQRRL